MKNHQKPHVMNISVPKFLKISVLIIFCISMMGCAKLSLTKTTLTIVNNMENPGGSLQYLDGTLWEVVVFCFIGEDIAEQINVDPVPGQGGESEKIEIKSSYEKVKVSFKMLPPESPLYDLYSNSRKYVVSYTFLEKGRNNVITIDGNTMVSGSIKTADPLSGGNLLIGIQDILSEVN